MFLEWKNFRIADAIGISTYLDILFLNNFYKIFTNDKNNKKKKKRRKKDIMQTWFLTFKHARMCWTLGGGSVTYGRARQYGDSFHFRLFS